MIDDGDIDAVFYAEGNGITSRFMRRRAGSSDETVIGILGLVDDEVLEARSLASTRAMRCAGSVDVQADDELQALDGDAHKAIAAGDWFVVLDHPQRTVDGAELQFRIGSKP